MAVEHDLLVCARGLSAIYVLRNKAGELSGLEMSVSGDMLPVCCIGTIIIF